MHWSASPLATQTQQNDTSLIARTILILMHFGVHTFQQVVRFKSLLGHEGYQRIYKPQRIPCAPLQSGGAMQLLHWPSMLQFFCEIQAIS